MKFNKKLLINIFIAAIAMILVAVASPAKAEHAVGFAVGSTRGVGAPYRYLPDREDTSPWGWQVTGLPFITPNEGTISAGGAVLYRFHQGNAGMAYASLGAGSLFMWDLCDMGDDLACNDEKHWGVGVGPGVGFDLRLVENIALSVEIPLALMFADGEFYGLYPVPNAALVYHW